MLQVFDPVLCRHYASLKKSGVNLSTYLDCNMELVCLLLDQADVQAVMGATGGWQKVKNQLARLVKSCQLGMAMFSFSEGVLAASEYSELVDKELMKLAVDTSHTKAPSLSVMIKRPLVVEPAGKTPSAPNAPAAKPASEIVTASQRGDAARVR